MINIKVIGYYYHRNLGDDQYQTTFNTLFSNYTFINNVDFIDCDKLIDTLIEEDDVIVLGGGDILNDYFIDKIIAKFYNKPNKIIGVSVGLPYTDILINTTKLSIIDHIFIRSYQDLPLFSKYFDPHRIHFIPDLAYLLLQTKKTKHHKKTKQIAISLTQNIYDAKNPEQYTSFVKSFVYFCRYLLTKHFSLTFVSFNTNHENKNENDNLIHQDILDNLSLITTDVLMAKTRLITGEPQEIFDMWSSFDYAICMKFHACIFSVYNNTPFLPVYTTRKVDNLLKDINYIISYKLPTDTRDLPLEIRIEDLINKFIELEKSDVSTDLYNYNQKFINKNMSTAVHKLQDILLGQTSRTFEVCTVSYKVRLTFRKIQDVLQERGYAFLHEVQDEHLQDMIVKLVSYNLCNTTESVYNWGLKEKMFKEGYNYSEEWKWILEDQDKPILNNPYGLFNLTYIDQEDYARVHRSGWQYVYENIKYLHNSNADLLLDLYLDKTFGWNSEINAMLGIIPYVSSWVGFIHHTFDTSFSKNNVYTLLNNSLFIDSIKYCRGIFVLSKHLKQQLKKELVKLRIKVKVFVIYHPAEEVEAKFNFSRFVKNDDRSVINIGGWLRNIYNYYSIEFPHVLTQRKCLFGKTELVLYKKTIKGKLMNNYYPVDDFSKNLLSILGSTVCTGSAGSSNCSAGSSNCSANCSSNCSVNCSSNCSANCSANCSSNCSAITNNWYNHFYRDVIKKLNSVQMLDCISNEEYDEILTKNVVFLNLIDASAVNTVIECVIRNTPIIINKLPAVVEVLGEDYPLYYTSDSYIKISEELSTLLTLKNIRRAHRYLERLDKEKLSIQYFMKQFVNNINTKLKIETIEDD
jgi:polysaccharide pyruvyl transferase WcaK-like protein